MVAYRCFITRALASMALLITAEGAAICQESPPRDVLVRFSKLDAQGGQLSTEGWQKIAELFVAPGIPRRDQITVVRDFVVSLPKLEKAASEFYVEYIQLGQIDASTARFSPLPTMKVRAGFYLIKDSEARWRIEGPVPEPHLTVDAAIRYASDLLANAGDVSSRRRADRLLAALKRFR